MSSIRQSDSDESRNGIRSPLLGNDVRLSKDRRRFIVLAVFDFSLLVLLWLICTVSNASNDIPSAVIHEVNIFDPLFFNYSLFDIIIIVFLRMIVLIVCYALLRFSHWLPVAITTATTSVFLLIKVLFFFSHRKTPAAFPEYLMVLSAFIVAWVELWFMPFKVLPHEREAEALISSPPTVRLARNIIPFSDDDFRSALEFTTDSDEEDLPSSNRINTSQQKRSKALYLKAISTAEEDVNVLLAASVDWRVMRAANPEVKLSESGAFYVRASFQCPPSALFDAVWKDSLKWNDQVLDAKDVLRVDERTTVFYSVSAPAMRGYIASRDFLDVRRVNLRPAEEQFLGVFVSVDSNILPPNANKKIIRGVNRPSMMKVSRGDEEGNAVLEWIMQCHLNGGLPRRIVQSSMLTFFVNNIAHLRDYLQRTSQGSSGTKT